MTLSEKQINLLNILNEGKEVVESESTIKVHHNNISGGIELIKKSTFTSLLKRELIYHGNTDRDNGDLYYFISKEGKEAIDAYYEEANKYRLSQKVTKEKVQLCKNLCIEAHMGQLRRDGRPYKQHPTRVAKAFEDNPLLACVALLHDVLEDTKITYDEMIKRGVPELVADHVRILTHSRDTPYEVYIGKIRKHQDCVKVKIADIVDNLTDNPTDNQILKYRIALTELAGVW